MFHECQYWTNLFPTCFFPVLSHSAKTCPYLIVKKQIQISSFQFCLPYVIIFGIGTMNVFIAIYFWIVIIL